MLNQEEFNPFFFVGLLPGIEKIMALSRTVCPTRRFKLYGQTYTASLKDQYDEISRRYDSIKDENRYLRSTLEFSKNEAIDLVRPKSFDGNFRFKISLA